MNKTKKRNSLFLIALLIGINIILPINANAKTLAQSFTSSISYKAVNKLNSKNGQQTYKKDVCAKTIGYYNKKQYHHVLAYIGGNRNSTNGCISKKRTYGYGNISATASQKSVVQYSINKNYSPSGNVTGISWQAPFLWKQIYFKTGYTKYGMGK